MLSFAIMCANAILWRLVDLLEGLGVTNWPYPITNHVQLEVIHGFEETDPLEAMAKQAHVLCSLNKIMKKLESTLVLGISSLESPLKIVILSE